MGVNARSLYRETRRRGVSRVAWAARGSRRARGHPWNPPNPTPSPPNSSRATTPPSPYVQTYKLGGSRVNTHNCIKLPGPPRIIGGRALNESPDYARDLALAANNSNFRVFLFHGSADSWVKLADDSSVRFSMIATRAQVDVSGLEHGENLELESLHYVYRFSQAVLNSGIVLDMDLTKRKRFECDILFANSFRRSNLELESLHCVYRFSQAVLNSCWNSFRYEFNEKEKIRV